MAGMLLVDPKGLLIGWFLPMFTDFSDFLEANTTNTDDDCREFHYYHYMALIRALEELLRDLTWLYFSLLVPTPTYSYLPPTYSYLRLPTPT